MATRLPNLANLTFLLRQIGSHDRHAASSALECAYDYMRCIAGAVIRGEFRRLSISSDTLVHEVYLRDLRERPIPIRSRSDFAPLLRFFMRRVMLDRARANGALKRRRQDAIRWIPDESAISIEKYALRRALERLRKLDARAARVVELRHLFGCTAEETAQRLGLTIRNVRDDWDFARVWLLDQLGQR